MQCKALCGCCPADVRLHLYAVQSRHAAIAPHSRGVQGRASGLYVLARVHVVPCVQAAVKEHYEENESDFNTCPSVNFSNLVGVNSNNMQQQFVRLRAVMMWL
jgi:hypothetical protein